MNDKKFDLILEGINYLMTGMFKKDSPILSDFQDRVCDCLHPKEEPTIVEKTHDAFSENEVKVPTHKEFQKAIDKSGLRDYEFKDDTKSELNEEDKK